MGRIAAWLGRALGAVPAGEMDGLQLEGPSWEVAGRRVDAPQFFRALERLVPEGSVLFLEGGAHPPPVQAFLEKRGVPSETRVARGTWCPRQSVVHLSATPPLLRAFAELAETCAEPELCEHLHVYRGQSVLLQWYDAFSDPFYISKQLNHDAVEAFCAELNVSWKNASATEN